MPSPTTREATTEAVSATQPSSTGADWTLILYFLALIALVPVAQVISELRRGDAIQELDVFRQTPTLEGLQAYERNLEDNSVVAEPVRKTCQWLNLVALRAGNEKAVIGRDHTIFYRPSLDAIVAPGFMADPDEEGHPVHAIVAFRDALRRHGVELVVLVMPGKQTIYPAWLSGRSRTSQGPPVNPDMPAFLAEMARRGVRVVDPTLALWGAKGGADLYLAHDTHWTPEGLAVVADELVRRLPRITGNRRKLRAVPLTVTRRGDLYDMLQLPDLPTAFAPQQVTIQRVVDAETGDPVEPDVDAPVVLLGDSFTNIYSVAEMGWGDHAGLGEQLALRLGQSIDVIAQNDGGVNTARATLARQPDCLKTKKLVIWQFAARDLVVSNGEWKTIDIRTRRG